VSFGKKRDSSRVIIVSLSDSSRIIASSHAITDKMETAFTKTQIQKLRSLLHKLPLNRAAGKDGIFAEHIPYASGGSW